MQNPPTNPSPAKIGVLIVEDQTAIRQMLAVVVAQLPDFEVIAGAGEVGAALRLAEERRPQVVVLDWILQGTGTGLDFLNGLKHLRHPPQVLVFSGNANERVVQSAMAHGAKGFIEKSASVAELTAALRAVAEGGIYFGRTVSKAMQQLTRQPGKSEIKPALLDRECEVLRHIASGLGSNAIARRLGLGVRAVNHQRAALVRKTGLKSIAQLTLYALQLGLISGAVHCTPGASGPSEGAPPMRRRRAAGVTG